MQPLVFGCDDRIAVFGEHDAFLARRRAREMARRLGFDQLAVGQVELAAGELADLLVERGASGGEVLITPLQNEGRVGLQVRTVESGGGSAAEDVVRDASRVDFDELRRRVDEFDVQAVEGGGRTVVFRKWLPG